MTFFDPAAYVILPWNAGRTPSLPDHLRCTYELVVSLAYSRDRRRTPPVTRRELAAWRGLAVRTIDEHLAALRQRGLIRNDPTFDGACLVLELLRPDDVPDWPPTSAPDAKVTDGVRQPMPPPSSKADDDDAEDRARPQGMRPHPLRPHPLRPTADTEEEDSLSHADHKHLLTSQALLEAGVYHGVAQRIAGLPWVTPDLVRRWVATLAQRKQVRHLGAVLASTLGDPVRCFPAPNLPPKEETPAPIDDIATQSASAAIPSRRPAPKIDVDWPAVLDRLTTSLGDRAVELWFGRARPVSQDQGALVIAMGSPHALDWVSARYLPELQRALNEVAGERLPVHLVLRG